MSSMDEAAGRLAHHLAHPTARACLPPLPLRSGFFSSFSLGALVYIRSNGKRYLLGGGLGFTLASRYLASLGGGVGWRGVHGKAGGRALCWGQSFAPGLGRPARHETETLIIRFVFVASGYMVRRQHQGHVPRRRMLVGVGGVFVEIGISVGYTKVKPGCFAGFTFTDFSSQFVRPSVLVWGGDRDGIEPRKGASKQLTVNPTRSHN